MRRRQQEHRADRGEQAAVGERPQDAPAVLVDDVADAQLAAAGEREDAVDAIGQAAQVRQRGQQLVADHLVAVDGRGCPTSSSPVAAATSDRSGASTRKRAVEGHERAREHDEVAGQADAELGERGDEVLQHRRLDRARRRARARP